MNAGLIRVTLTPTRAAFAGEHVSIGAVTSGGHAVEIRAAIPDRRSVRVGVASEWFVAESDVCWFEPGAKGRNLRPGGADSVEMVGV